MKADAKQLIAEFDFKKVHRLMTALNWEWGSSEGVPSIGEMRTVVTDLVESLYKHNADSMCISTGGFTVRRYYNEEHREIIEIEFVAVSLSTEEIEY